MIYCVWYPSGGFGHFINAILTLYGENFVRPSKSLEFSDNGNSHDLDLVVPKYFQECWPRAVKFLPDKNYCVLIDNGIDNESTRFQTVFPTATVIKICYSDVSWPIVARTMIDKAMQSDINKQLPIDHWGVDEPWARREKYFLFLRDHKFRYAWKSSQGTAVYIDQLYNEYSKFFLTLNSIVPIGDCEDLWNQWRKANAKYIDPICDAVRIVNCVKTKSAIDLTCVSDVWTQAVAYYFLWLEFGVEVPHNDYADWFTNTTDIVTMLNEHGVKI